MDSLTTAWKDGEVRPTHRNQPSAKHWWKTRVDPFADAWSTIERWLIAEPAVSANDLIVRLAAMIPDLYASKAQLRGLQRRVETGDHNVAALPNFATQKGTSWPTAGMLSQARSITSGSSHSMRFWRLGANQMVWGE
jgi:hypothetical protein